MAERLPPLTALRAFDAAARHMSFQKAAEELSVTPAALSFQIKTLEEHFGAPLFKRLNRAVELTEAGAILAPGARDGFEALGAAWRSAQRVNDQNTLTVTAGPSFTATWLAPRLYSFVQAHPEIELRLSASLTTVDLTRSEVDVAIRFGYGSDDPRLSVETLMQDWVTPVMTPELASRYSGVDGLYQMPLIHQDDIRFLDPPVDWPAWFRAAGHEPRDWAGQHYSQADHAIDAALSGAGVVLARIVFASRFLSDGRLIAPFNIGLGTLASYRFVSTKETLNRPHVAAFRQWLFDQVAGSESFDGQFELIDPRDVTPA
ncbi:MAG: transcriptional regulator GcvA [Pseudomonadota bacterium]